VIPTLYRAPEFPPEPPVFDNEDDCILSPETPFEVYIYLKAFRSRTNLAEYLEYFGQFVASYPGFANSNGDEDDSDVQPAGVAVAIPPHFNQTYVHFLPGGYLNGHTVRLSYLGKSKFNFLHEELLTEWLTKLHGDKRPRRILDIGTGPGFSAFVLAQLFPEAEVVAIDLAAPYIRMARRWAELRNVSNVAFYHANAEDLSWLESDSFDLINYAYVLHEMPRDNAKNILTGDIFFSLVIRP
jgi:SAM-dependent methyltransferase